MMDLGDESNSLLDYNTNSGNTNNRNEVSSQQNPEKDSKSLKPSSNTGY